MGRVAPFATYREQNSSGRWDIDLYPTKVVMRGRYHGDPFETTIPLDQVHPDFGFRWSRPRRPYVAAAPAVFFAAVAMLYVKIFEMPVTSAPVGIMLGISAAAGSLALYCLPRVRTFSFVNLTGVAVLTVTEAGPQRSHAEAFVQRIREAIIALREETSDTPMVPLHPGSKISGAEPSAAE